jgi:hypothetical protein
VHSVDKVDVRMADRAVHRCRAACKPGTRVAGQVVAPAVSLGLNDSADGECAGELAGDEDAQQIARHALGRSGEEATIQRFERRYTITA